jgi:putative iron-dependent peroxidase
VTTPQIGYGTLTRHGTIFVGFSRDRERLDAMLDSMTGRGGGARDRLTEFAHAITGAYYFVPSSEALATFAARPATKASAAGRSGIRA